MSKTREIAKKLNHTFDKIEAGQIDGVQGYKELTDLEQEARRNLWAAEGDEFDAAQELCDKLSKFFFVGYDTKPRF